MLIAIAADLHFRGKKLQDKRKAWEQAVDKMIERKVDAVILAGDTFDSRNIGSREANTGSVYEAFITPAQRLLDKGIDVVAIKGNGVHEGTSGEQASPLEVFKGTGIKVIDKLDQFRLLDGVLMAFIPWIEDENRDEKLRTWIAEISTMKAAYKLVVGHLSVWGATLNSGVAMQGAEFEVTREQLEATGANMILLGHIHLRQKISENIFYVGALTQDSFGDEGNPQGFMLIDTDKKTREFIEVDAPRYTTVDIKSESERVHLNESDYSKVRFHIKPSQEALDSFSGSTNAEFEIVPDREVTERKVDGIDSGRSDEELLVAWLKSKEKSDDDIKRIIKEAREVAK